MALTRTTLSSAKAVDDREIVVASATGFAAGRLVRIDQEFFVVQQSYSSGTTIPVRGGQLGTKAVAHVASAGVVVGTQADDWDTPGPASKVNNPTAGRGRIITSITADNSTVTHPSAGNDHIVVLNGTSVINLTVPIPTTDMDGDLLWIIGNGTAAHVVTFTGGIGGEGTSYDVVTANASGPVALGPFVACNAVWLGSVAVPMAGTVTNLTATVA